MLGKQYIDWSCTCPDILLFQCCELSTAAEHSLHQGPDKQQCYQLINCVHYTNTRRVKYHNTDSI